MACGRALDSRLLVRRGSPKHACSGQELRIAGKTERINLAEQWPDLPLAYLSGQGHTPAGPFVGQEIDTSTMGPGTNAPMSGMGSGPRIYVGGIPTAVSETMVRNHFTQWGQVVDVYFPKDKHLNKRKNFCFVTFATQQAAEKAAAQSDREINGYRIESISITHDRQVHYQRQALSASQANPQGLGSVHNLGAEGSNMRWMGTARGRDAPADLAADAASLHQSLAGLSIGAGAGLGQSWPLAARAAGRIQHRYPAGLPTAQMGTAPGYGPAAPTGYKPVYGTAGGGYENPGLVGTYGAGIDAMFDVDSSSQQGTPQDDHYTYMIAQPAIQDHNTLPVEYPVNIMSYGLPPAGSLLSASDISPFMSINSNYPLLVGGSGVNMASELSHLSVQHSLTSLGSSPGTSGLPEMGSGSLSSAAQLLVASSHGFPQQQSLPNHCQA